MAPATRCIASCGVGDSVAVCVATTGFGSLDIDLSSVWRNMLRPVRMKLVARAIGASRRLQRRAVVGSTTAVLLKTQLLMSTHTIARNDNSTLFLMPSFDRSRSR